MRMRQSCYSGWGPPFVVVAGPSPLLADSFGCRAPPLVAGVRRRSLATPGRGLPARFPATPGWGPLVVVVEVRSQLLAEGPGGCSPSSFLGWSLLVAVLWRCCRCMLACCVVVCGLSLSPWPWCVCVCVLYGASCRCGRSAGFVCGLLAVCAWVCAVSGLLGMSYLVRFASSADMITKKGEKRGPVDV